MEVPPPSPGVSINYEIPIAGTHELARPKYPRLSSQLVSREPVKETQLDVTKATILV